MGHGSASPIAHELLLDRGLGLVVGEQREERRVSVSALRALRWGRARDRTARLRSRR